MTSPATSPRGRRWRAAVAICGAALVALVAIIVAWSLDRQVERPPSRLSGIDVERLVEPAPLTDEERQGRGGSAAELARPGAVELAEGGWVEVADGSGRLRQRYAAARMDPLPDRWMSLVAPKAIFYGEDGRVTRVAGLEGTARIPDRAIESGTLRGEVRIEVFRPDEGGRVSLEEDQPWLVVLADEVEFDGAEGRLRSDRAVSIESPELSFSGEGLLLFLDASGREIERLVVERATSPIRLIDLEGGGPLDSTEPADGAAAGVAGAPASGGAAAPAVPAPAANTTEPRLFRLALDGGVVVKRFEQGVRSTIEGERLGAIFSMRSGSLGAIASRAPSPRRGEAPWSGPLPPPAWIAAAAIANATPSPVEIEIEFGGSLVIEPVPSGVPRPASAKEVWVRVEGTPVRVVDESREAVVRCGILEARTGGAAGDRLDLISPGGFATIESPALEVASPAIRVAGRSIDLAGPGWLELGESAPREDAAPEAPPERVRIEWPDRLALGLGADERSLERATFLGGERGPIVLDSPSLRLEAASLEAVFFARTDDADRDRLRRVDARGEVVAIRRGSIGRLEASSLAVELRDDPERTVVERFEAEGGVRALDAERIVFAERLEATFLPPAAASEPARQVDDRTAAFGSAEIDRASASGGVIAGLADGTWVFADRLSGDGPAGRLSFEGGGSTVALCRDTAVLDGLASLELRDSSAGRRASAPGAGRVRSGSAVALTPWASPTEPEVHADAWSWPAPPSRPEIAGETRLVAVWSDGLDFDEPAADESRVGGPVAELVVRASADASVRARAIGEGGREDRVSAQELRVEFRRAAPDGEGDSASREWALEPSELLAIGSPATLEARRPKVAKEGAAEDPDVFRIVGPRIEYELGGAEGRVIGAGSLLVSEAPTAESEGGTARFRWKGRLDLIRTAPDRSLVTLSDDVEMVYAARSGEGGAITVTASRMEATVAEPAAPPSEAPEPSASAAFEEAELRSVRGFGRVFVRGEGRDVECDAFEYDVESGIATLTARPGRSVSVLTRGTPGPVRAAAVKWNLRTGRIEVIDGRGEG